MKLFISETSEGPSSFMPFCRQNPVHKEDEQKNGSRQNAAHKTQNNISTYYLEIYIPISLISLQHFAGIS